MTYYSQCIGMRMYKIKGVIVIGPYISLARITLNHRICLLYFVLQCAHMHAPG